MWTITQTKLLTRTSSINILVVFIKIIYIWHKKRQQKYSMVIEGMYITHCHLEGDRPPHPDSFYVF